MSATSQAAAIRSAPERSFVQVTRLRVKQPPGLRGAESSFLFIVALLSQYEDPVWNDVAP